MTNVLGCASMNDALFPNKYFSYTNPRCCLIHLINLIHITELELINCPSKLIILELQKLQEVLYTYINLV
jgi:hypothetical protein